MKCNKLFELNIWKTLYVRILQVKEMRGERKSHSTSHGRARADLRINNKIIVFFPFHRRLIKKSF